MSTLDDTLKLEATAVRRLEVITGTGRRREFSDDFKAGNAATMGTMTQMCDRIQKSRAALWVVQPHAGRKIECTIAMPKARRGSRMDDLIRPR